MSLVVTRPGGVPSILLRRDPEAADLAGAGAWRLLPGDEPRETLRDLGLPPGEVVDVGTWVPPEDGTAGIGSGPDAGYERTDGPDEVVVRRVRLGPEAPDPEGGEGADEGPVHRWWSPARILERRARGGSPIAPPAGEIVDAMARAEEEGEEVGLDALASALERARDRSPVLEVAGGVWAIPLHTRTIFPATHTNAVVVAARAGDVLVCDPGPSGADALRPLLDLLDALEAEGGRVRTVVITHGHPDHVGGIDAVAARGEVEVIRHPGPSDGLVELEGSRGTRRVRAIPTPGHASDHLAWLDERTGTLAAGDVLAGVGTVVINPPSGDMVAYFSSLERVIAEDPVAVVPGHGPVAVPGRPLAEETLAHRRRREESILDAVRAASPPVGPPAIVSEVYEGVPAFLHDLAERTVRAHLAKLEAEGRVVRSQGGWTAA